jgi:hypothetical protein
LHRQDDLTEDELSGAAFAIERNDDHDRNDRDAARHEPARPVRQAQPEKAFHHDLAGQRRRHRRVETGCKQRDREKRRCDTEA